MPSDRSAVGLRSLAAHNFYTFRTWYWALIPLVAVAAYASVLRIGFLADDFFQLYEAKVSGLDPATLLPYPQVGFYRPVGVWLTYKLGWQMWGYDPLPYHVESLVAHAGSALMLGLWLGIASGRRWMGWLAGALFAVFPLHLEAVGWVAVQYDALSALFGIGSVLFFTLWWMASKRGGSRGPWLYGSAWLVYGLAVFSKESLLTFAPVLGAAAWYAAPPQDKRQWRKLALASVALLIPVLLNLLIRYIAWGALGGYGAARIDYQNFAWDSLITYVRMLVSPINAAVLGQAAVQIVGTICTVALLAGLTLYGSGQKRLLLVAALWVVLPIIPVLNIALAADALQQALLPVRLLSVPLGMDTLEQNRHIYLASAGYMAGVAGLICSAIRAGHRWRPVLVAVISVVIAASAVVSWVQLQPWRTASVQVNDLEQELLRLIPAQTRPNGMVWYVDNTPYRYKGVTLLISGLGLARVFLSGDYPLVERVPDATQAPINDTKDKRDAFAIRFAYDGASDRFVVDYAAGITGASNPPSQSEGNRVEVWDFRPCEPSATRGWQVIQASTTCIPGDGLKLSPDTGDPQLVGPTTTLEPGALGGRFVRLRVAIRYPEGGKQGLVSQWFWKGQGYDFGGERNRTLPIKQDGEEHVYWAFVRASETGQAITRLRFDPVNSQLPVTVEWIAVDMVK